MRIRCGTLTTLLIGTSIFSAKGAQQPGSSEPPRKVKAESVYSEISKAPDKARAKRNPLEKDTEAVAAGRILFQQHCAECHGDNAEGGKKAPSLRVPEIQSAEPGAIFWILTNGVVRKGMPVWSKLPEPQRWQLVTFIQSLGIPRTKTEISPVGCPQSRPATDSSSRRR